MWKRRWIVAVVLLLACSFAQGQSGSVRHVSTKPDTTTPAACSPEGMVVVVNQGADAGEHACCEDIGGGTLRWQDCDVGAGGGGGASVADNTGTIGLSRVNGAAATAMRSDGTPPLSQAIAPTWTGIHQFNSAVRFAIEGAVTHVRAYDFDGDGTLEMTDLQSIEDLYGGSTVYVIPAGNWIGPLDSANSTGVLEFDGSNVMVQCEPGAILNGPLKAGGQETTGGSSTVLTDSTQSWTTDQWIGAVIYNWTDGSKCTVTDSAENTITCAAGLAAGVVGDCIDVDSPYDACTGSGAGSGFGVDTTFALNDFYAVWDPDGQIRAVVFSGGTNVRIDGCEVDYGLPVGSATTKLEAFPIQPGMAISMLDTTNAWVTRNYAHDTSHSGIFYDTFDGAVVTDNIVRRAGRYDEDDFFYEATQPQNAIQLYTSGVYTRQDSKNAMVAQNLVENFTANCVNFRVASSSQSVSNVVVGNMTCTNGDIATSGATSCVKMTGVDGGVASNITCVNAPFATAAGDDFQSNGDANSELDVSYANFNIDNSTATNAAGAPDFKLAEFGENIRIAGFQIRSSGAGYCLDMDPPWINTVIDGITFEDCSNALGLWTITNVSATEEAIGASGDCTNNDCTTGVTRDPAYDLRIKNMEWIGVSHTVLRALGDVAIFGMEIDGLRITTTGTADIFRFLNDGTFDFPRNNIEIRNAEIYAPSAIDFIALEDSGSVEVERFRIDEANIEGLNGVVFQNSSATATNLLTMENVRCFSDTATDCDSLVSLTTTGTNFFIDDQSGCYGSAPNCSWTDTLIKKSDEIVSNSTTLQADDELTFPVEAGRYAFEFRVHYSTAALPDFKFNVTCPTQNSAFIENRFYEATATEIGSEVPKDSCGWTSTTSTSTSMGWAISEGFVDLSADGNITFQWAQNSLDAGTNTTVLAGSSVSWRRLD